MTTYQLMYEFQKDLLFDNAVEKAAEIARYRLHTKESLSDKAVEKHLATKEELLAMLIDAAGRCCRMRSSIRSRVPSRRWTSAQVVR